MTTKRLIDITMTSFFLLLLLVPATARYVSGGAIETQAGIVPMDGVSPVPTEAPGLNGIPKELRRRAIASPNWCGMLDGNSQSIVSCLPGSSCVLKSNFYIACGCTSLNTALCFNSVLPTICFDYAVYQLDTRVGSLTAACVNPYTPYCLTITSLGFSSQFSCGTTNFPRTHSFVPLAAYSSSSIKFPSISPAKTSAATIPASRRPLPTSDSNSESSGKKKFKLPHSAKAGIGSGVGLVTLAIIALIAFCLRQKRKGAHVSPTYGGAGPVMAQTNNTPQGYQSAAQPVQQQYQPQPQAYRGAAQPDQQQYQPQPQGYQNAAQPIQQYQPQLNNTKLPDSADVPPYPAPVYTSGSQYISAAPIPPNGPTSDTKITRKYPSSTVTPVPPLTPDPSHQTHQQQQNTAPSWDYPPNSPISTLGPERSDLHHQDIPPSQSELGVGEAGVQHHTGTLWNHSELPGAGEARAHYPGAPNNNNHSELPGAGEARPHYPGPS